MDGAIMKTAFILLGFAIIGGHAELKVTNSWKYLEFDGSTAENKYEEMESRKYDRERVIPVDVDVSSAGRVFMTVLRQKGVPATLTTLVPGSKGSGGGPLLQPFPGWSWVYTDDCSNVIAVHRIAVDKCDRLWLIDTGVIDNHSVCPPKLLAFDTTTDDLLEEVQIPKDVINGDYGRNEFLNIVVDTAGDDCKKTHVYLADGFGNGLVVWNGRSFWRLRSPNFEAQENASTFKVKGEKTYNLTRGILGMSITQEEPDIMNRQLYFRPLSSFDLFHAKVRQLHDFRKMDKKINYVKEPSQLSSQSVSQAFSSQGILFYSSTSDSSILCWNRHKTFEPKNTATVAADVDSLGWASGIKVIPKKNTTDETLWILTNRWDRYAIGDMKFTETNFRILVGRVTDLVKGTVCE